MNENEEKAEVRELPPGEAAAEFGEEPTDQPGEYAGGSTDGEAPGAAEAKNDTDERPEWAKVPDTVKMPPPGASVGFIRIPANWTMNPSLGARWCMCTMITETEERLAYQRARGDQIRAIAELAKATIRCVDGHKANWDQDMSKAGSVARFWSSIGPKGRQAIRNFYTRTHTISEPEALDFFANHFAYVTVS